MRHSQSEVQCHLQAVGLAALCFEGIGELGLLRLGDQALGLTEIELIVRLRKQCLVLW